MNISLEWLGGYVDLPADLAVLEDVLTRAGLSVESIEQRGVAFDKVVVAEILASEQHPNADRLSVCRVNDGSGIDRQIVCGAKNYRVGDKVPLALPGAILPGDFRIKTGKLRGVESEGMMCSGKELGLDADGQGLLILPADAVPGTPIGEVFPPQTTLELEITPNRPDWLGHVGVAREVAAFTGATLKLPAVETPGTVVDPAVARLEVAEGFYSLRRLGRVRVEPSPAWLRQRLEAVGLRPINNIVDATNYVMFETGQPLHAFDAAKVRGAIVVRTGLPDESLEALDGRTYPAEGHLVIADEAGPLAFAGIMGGESSGVTGATTEVLLESAVFAPGKIRASARALGLFTDSSYRFERGVDPQGVLPASARVVALLGDAVEPAGPPVTAGALPGPSAPVQLRNLRCRELLGAPLSDEEIAGALEGFGLRNAGDGHWHVPSFRLDVHRETDLIEEVARAVGIERIPSRVTAWPSPASDADQLADFCGELRSRLCGAGFHEARTSTLVSRSMASGFETAIRLRNPLGEDQAILRPSMIPGLLGAVERNIRHSGTAIRLFEIGKVFGSKSPEEEFALGLVMTGDRCDPTWRDKDPAPADIFDLKAAIATLLPVPIDWIPAQPGSGRAIQATLHAAGFPVGTAWQLAPSDARLIDAPGAVVAAELDVHSLLLAARQSRAFVPPPSYPATSRDIAMVAPLELTFREVETVLRSIPQPFLESIMPVDLYQDPTGQRLTKDSKSLAISLTFRAHDRTLLADEVNALIEGYKSRLREVLSVAFRE